MSNLQTNPLVSIRILTYNSAKYIKETLDSVYHQTYNNIELIVSDDCSKDETVCIIDGWINKHKNRFAKVSFLTTSVNTGVCANSKRSLEAVTGEWIKGLGGDDCLYPNAIEDYVRFVQNNHCQICAAQMEYIDGKGNDYTGNLDGGTYDSYMRYLHLPYEKQRYLINYKIFVPGPVLFYSRVVYEKTGGPDAKYGTADEWSFLYKIINSGYRIYPLEKALIRYRVHTSSLTRKEKWDSSHPSVVCNRSFMKEVILNDLLHKGELLKWWHLYVKYLSWGNLKMRRLKLIDPLWYYDKIMKY